MSAQGSRVDHRFNPGSGVLLIEAPVTGSSLLSVLDAQGRSINEMIGVGQMRTILDAGSGIRLIRLTHDGEVWTTRVATHH